MKAPDYDVGSFKQLPNLRKSGTEIVARRESGMSLVVVGKQGLSAACRKLLYFRGSMEQRSGVQVSKIWRPATKDQQLTTNIIQ